jgi:hypothetical protein
MEHRWRSLNSSEQILWYDERQMDAINSAQFEIWILEMYKPAFQFQGLANKVARSMTLYAVDKTTRRYAIRQAIFLDDTYKELGNYSYPFFELPEEVRYNIPIQQKSFMAEFLFELARKQAAKH